MITMHYVSVLVIRPNGGGHELLLGLRAQGRYMGGTWQLITGGIEPGETAWRAARREVMEETGLAIDESYRLSVVTQFYRPDLDALCTAPMFCVLVAAGAEPTINPEHAALHWTPLDEAADRLMWPTDVAALDQARRQILENGPAKPHLRIDAR